MDRGTRIGLWTYAGFAYHFDEELEEEMKEYEAKMKGSSGESYGSYVDPDLVDGD